MRITGTIAFIVTGLILTSPALATETITYSYDAHGRLVQVVHSGTVNNGQATVYTQDAADNRTQVTTTTTGASH